MIRIIEVGKLNREKKYYSKICGWCQSRLVFEFGDIWLDNPNQGTGRIECPVCRTKLHFSIPYSIEPCLEVTKDIYESAHRDASRSGLQMLIDEKKKEV